MRYAPLALPLLAASLTLLLPASARADATRVVVTAEGHALTVGGQPFEIKGAGGDGDKPLLAASGANAFRTWGVDDKTQALLDEAQANGLKVAVGFWMGHARHGFDYGDAAAVKQQLAEATAAVKKYKDHPALLLWGVGNEMEEYAATTDPRVWEAVNDVAAMIKKVDPDHPTMTVIAEIGGDKLASIKRYCPAIDIVGINTYGGVTSIPTRYAEADMDRPYVVTEFGPPGTWEIPRNGWDVPEELSSTAKADVYAKAYDVLHADPTCLGSFAFTWGFKQEATATWFGMVLPDGSKLGAVDALTKAWSGKPAADLTPQIASLSIAGEPVVAPGAAVAATLDARDPEGAPLATEWVLFQEMEVFESMGDFRPTPPTFPDAIEDLGDGRVTVTMPKRAGNYRLFAYTRDGSGGAAVANLPLKVEGGGAAVPHGVPTALPLVVYGDGGATPFVASGYMGQAASVTMDEASAESPHAGATCLKITYAEAGNWAGVVWQSPANDWGDVDGGFDLTDAATLSFWVRGAAGGETVKFGYGLLGRDKKFYDTDKDEVEVTLSQKWKQVTLQLTGKQLSRVKTGFYWTLAGQGKPVTFYLDDIVYGEPVTAAEPQ